MKQDVDQVVRTLLGLIGLCDFPPGGLHGHQNMVITSEDFRWEVTAPRELPTSALCWRIERDQPQQLLVPLYESIGSGRFRQKDGIVLTHQALPLLVRGVMDFSPSVRAKIQPLLDAANI